MKHKIILIYKALCTKFTQTFCGDCREAIVEEVQQRWILTVFEWGDKLTEEEKSGINAHNHQTKFEALEFLEIT